MEDYVWEDVEEVTEFLSDGDVNSEHCPECGALGEVVEQEDDYDVLDCIDCRIRWEFEF